MLRECVSFVFFFKQKTAYVLRISDGNSDVCSSDLQPLLGRVPQRVEARDQRQSLEAGDGAFIAQLAADLAAAVLRQIGRASCRERGCRYATISADAVSVRTQYRTMSIAQRTKLWGHKNGHTDRYIPGP